MKTNLCIALLLFGCLSVSVVTARASLVNEIFQEDERVTELILALDESTSPNERSKIIGQLIDLGPNALASLKKPPKGLSRQTELLLTRIRNEIEKNANSKSSLSSRFSLVGEIELHEAIKSIQNQTGIQLKFNSAKPNQTPSTAKKNFQLKDTEFWPGMDRVLDAFSMDLGRNLKPGTLELRAAEKGRRRLRNCGYGPLVRAEAVSFASGIDLKQQASKDKLKVEIRWEPSTMPTQILIDHNDLVITGSANKTLKSTKADRTTYHILRNQTHIVVDFEFESLPRRSLSIESVKASMLMTAPVGRKDFEFDDILNVKNKSMRHADMTVTVESTGDEDDSEFKVRMNFLLDNAGDSLESHRGWMFHNVAQLVDKKGNRFLPSRMVTNTQKKDKMGFTFFFKIPDGPAGCKFVYQSPTSVQKIPIEIAIKNIELE